MSNGNRLRRRKTLLQSSAIVKRKPDVAACFYLRPALQLTLVFGSIGGGEDQESHARRGGQVPIASQVPAAQDDLGRRGDDLLFQGEVARRAQGLLPAESLPDAGREAHARQEDGTHPDPSVQLVQKPSPA